MMQPRGVSARAQIEAAGAALFGSGVAVVAGDIRAPEKPCWGGEDAHLARAVPARRAEFAAGRHAARVAMARLGMVPCPVPAAADRAPVWPQGLAGSISHSGAHCIAALGLCHRSIGVDLEPDTALDADLVPLIASDAELGGVTGPARLHRAKVIFCAKEAAYKAQYPLTGTLLEFTDFAVTVDEGQGGFAATFQRSVGEFEKGDALPGRFARVAGHVLTAVTIANH